MEKNANNFIQANSPDGGFLQSEEWRVFQESCGHRTFNLEGESFWANIIEHQLKIVGNYFYVPRGPIVSQVPQTGTPSPISELIDLAREEKAGWIRIEPANEEILRSIQTDIQFKVAKAPHDMQPKEIFAVDIAKSEEQLLSEMKSKTRYNLRLAEKKEVVVKVKTKMDGEKELEEFLRLVKITARRNEISAHPENYYRQMWKTIPAEMLKLYVAEYEGKIIAANLVLYFGKFATYLHGASDNEFREAMAPYLLQWRSIQDAKNGGLEKYDFGGVKTWNLEHVTHNKWQGITKFKLGFSPETRPVEFPGAYDIILNRKRYYAYRVLQFIKNILN